MTAIVHVALVVLGALAALVMAYLAGFTRWH